MKILLRRLDNDRHRLVVERADGSRLERELETRSVLLHDLVHLAVEAQADLTDGFWGMLADGADFDELMAGAGAPNGETTLAESLVGPMQSVWNGHLDPDGYVELVRHRAPFVDRAFVDAVLDRIRRLWGQWKATPFHETMTLTWPPGESRLGCPPES